MAIAFALGTDRLPPGRHAATPAEIEALLVDGFAKSQARRPLFDSWQNVVGAIARIVAIDTHWMDGSFVTKKEEPADIDVVTHVDGQALEALDAVDQTLLRGLVGNKVSQELHGCDSISSPSTRTATPRTVRTGPRWRTGTAGSVRAATGNPRATSK